MAESLQSARSRGELPRRLNMACGRDVRAGWVNTDVSRDVGADVVMDAFRVPWDLPSDHFDEVHCAHFLEHVPREIDGRPGLVVVMEEFWRVSRDRARLEFRFPFAGNALEADADPTHTGRVCASTMNYFHPEHAFSYYTRARFVVESVAYRRRVRFGERVQDGRVVPVFDSRYHVAKYFRGWCPNVGAPFETRVVVRAVKPALHGTDGALLIP